MEIQSRGHGYGVKHFQSPATGPLSSVVCRALDLTEEKFKELSPLGAIYKNEQRVTEPQELVHTGDLLRVHTTPRRFPTQKITPDLVVFENADFVILNKPVGVPVHATVDNLRENILTILSEQLQTPLKITHRLDIATQGLMLMAKTDDYQKTFNKYLSQSQVTKIYRALVTGNNIEPNKTHVHYMEPSPRAPKNVQNAPQPGWAKCVLTILESKPIAPDVSEVQIRLETGRTHQIRAQMAALHHPLVADQIYGGAAHPLAPQLFLQSFKLSFPENFHFTAP